MTATSFDKDGIRMVVMSTGAPFGLNTSNTTQKPITEAMNAVCNYEDMRTCKRELGGIYIDDMWGMCINSEILYFFQSRRQTSDRFEGLDSLSSDKSRYGEFIKGLEYQIDTRLMSIGLADSMIEKYIWVMFHLLPSDCTIGTPQFQSHMLCSVYYCHTLLFVHLN